MKRTLLATPSLRVELAAFAPRTHQARHRDACSRVSLVLHGAFSEEAAAGSARLAPGDVLFKSAAAAHEDRFSHSGAKLVSIVFGDDSFELSGAPAWRVRRDPAAMRCAWTAFEAAAANDDGSVIAAASDLLAGDDEGAGMGQAPPWLTRLKTALEEDTLASIDIAAEARAAGVHPAHASRLFRRRFGVSITDCAQAHSVRRALAHMAQPLALSQIAVAAGFYDQSHMTRVFRRMTGLTPGAHRALLAAAG